MATANPSTVQFDMPPAMVWPTTRPRIAWLQDALRQLDAIERLPSGWDSQGGDVPDPRIVDGARVLLLALAVAHDSLAKPEINPTPSGGVQFHWESGPRYFEIELVDHHSARFYFVDRTGKTETGGDLHVGDSLAQVVELACAVAVQP